MYNEEKKLAWMADAERRGALNKRGVAVSHLNKIANAVEFPLDADIFDLVQDGRKADVIDAMNRNGGCITYSTVRRLAQTINAYLDWRFAVDASSVASADERFGTYEFSLVDTYRSPTYLLTQDELSGALSHYRIEEGRLLPVFAALAWAGYEPTGMIRIMQEDVDDSGSNIIIDGKILPDGFINDTLLYYSRTEKYNKGAYGWACIKEDGQEFLRNIVVADNPRPKANMLTKIRDMACKTELLNGGTIVYLQLNQAGAFHEWLEAERNGATIDVDWFKRNKGINALTAKEHEQEFRDFKIAMGLS